MMEWTLEHVHIYAGTPWWISIALTAILVRVILFKPYIDAAENGARMAAVMPFTKPLTDKMTQLSREGKTGEVMRIRGEIQLINKRAGVRLWKSLVPMVQVVAGYGTFVLLRAASKLPVPGLESGGILWFHNLTIPDPYFAMPLATSAILFLLLRVRHFRPDPNSTCRLANRPAERRRNRRVKSLPRCSQRPYDYLPSALLHLHILVPGRGTNLLLHRRNPFLHPVDALPATLVSELL